jgi:hypothetical protein
MASGQRLDDGITPGHNSNVVRRHLNQWHTLVFAGDSLCKGVNSSLNVRVTLGQDVHRTRDLVLNKEGAALMLIVSGTLQLVQGPIEIRTRIKLWEALRDFPPQLGP